MKASRKAWRTIESSTALLMIISDTDNLSRMARCIPDGKSPGVLQGRLHKLLERNLTGESTNLRAYCVCGEGGRKAWSGFWPTRSNVCCQRPTEITYESALRDSERGVVNMALPQVE